jgi:uncharacterized membrane protein YqaE (UPF0057 family)
VHSAAHSRPRIAEEGVRPSDHPNKRNVVVDNKIILVILSIVLAPLAVFLKEGVGKHLLINIVLCFFSSIYRPCCTHCTSC